MHVIGFPPPPFFSFGRCAVWTRSASFPFFRCERRSLALSLLFLTKTTFSPPPSFFANNCRPCRPAVLFFLIGEKFFSWFFFPSYSGHLRHIAYMTPFSPRRRPSRPSRNPTNPPRLAAFSASIDFSFSPPHKCRHACSSIARTAVLASPCALPRQSFPLVKRLLAFFTPIFPSKVFDNPPPFLFFFPTGYTPDASCSTPPLQRVDDSGVIFRLLGRYSIFPPPSPFFPPFF